MSDQRIRKEKASNVYTINLTGYFSFSIFRQFRIYIGMDTYTAIILIFYVFIVITCQPPSCTSATVKSSIHVEEGMPEGMCIGFYSMIV